MKGRRSLEVEFRVVLPGPEPASQDAVDDFLQRIGTAVEVKQSIVSGKRLSVQGVMLNPEEDVAVWLQILGNAGMIEQWETVGPPVTVLPEFHPELDDN